ncbi:glutathione S-transferase [Chitinimonas arctica]|uniref:Glutathione S-transferase n=2 Tax=Chitinimonas arctica TaxID=2594795 RepID=A0A516SMJ0_9NEIS|nr:glutathione S-transferase [Chitinimonas arctica]
MTPHILLEELGLPFTLIEVDQAGGELDSPAYRRLNPNGLIPVLAEGDLVLYETAAICLHLLDNHPAAGLAPLPGSVERAHFYKWLSWLSTTLQPTMIAYFYASRWADEPAAIAQVKAHAEQKATNLLQQLEDQLAGHGQAWLLGDRFSAVDIYAFMLCRWTRNFSRPARSLPRLGEYLQRVLARPAVQRAIAREGLQAPLV